VASSDEFILLTAVIPVKNPEKHLVGLRKVQDQCNQIGIRTIFVIDEYENLNPQDLNAVRELKGNTKPFSKVIEGSFGNPGAARNAALDEIETQWLTFWDADDVPFPLECKKSLTLFPCADLIVGGYEISDGHTLRRYSTFSLIDLSFNPGIWRLIFDSKLFLKKRFPALSMGEDQILLIDLDLGNKQIEYVDTCFYRYYTNIEGQLTKSRNALFDLDKCLALVRTMIGKSSTEKYKQVIAVRLLMTYLKQKGIRNHRKVLYTIKYFNKDFLNAFVVVLIKKIRSHG
jgi:glycosyltransferase involved in cell wall biosynthesis